MSEYDKPCPGIDNGLISPAVELISPEKQRQVWRALTPAEQAAWHALTLEQREASKSMAAAQLTDYVKLAYRRRSKKTA